jgi:hypothetical protein
MLHLFQSLSTRGRSTTSGTRVRMTVTIPGAPSAARSFPTQTSEYLDYEEFPIRPVASIGTTG